jgi:CRP-like cAMP-binding protein
MSSISTLTRFPQARLPRAAAVPTPAFPPPTQNRLIAACPAEVYDRLHSHLLPLTLSFGEIICEAGAEQEFAYFPVGAVVSFLLGTTDQGVSAEVGTVGNDGVVGTSLFLGGRSTFGRALAQIGGQAYKVRANVLLTEFSKGGAFQRTLLRYVQAFLSQVSQIAVCNRLHPVEKRLCRWLLLTQDRAQTDHLSLTQELIANLLGTRRESVTVAAARLQDAGLIHYSRGNIRMLNRAGLELAACECYRTVTNEYDRLLGCR